MRILIVEDDSSSRVLLQKILAQYGETHVATNGKEAVEAFRTARGEQRSYDLICLDIMMPEMDGHEVLKEIRALEEGQGITGLDGVKIIMTTALSDGKNIMNAFNAQCEAYVVKPVDKKKLLEHMEALGLLDDSRLA